MRADATHRLLLNAPLFHEFSIAVSNEKYVRFTVIEGGNPISYMLRVRFFHARIHSLGVGELMHRLVLPRLATRPWPRVSSKLSATRLPLSRLTPSMSPSARPKTAPSGYTTVSSLPFLYVPESSVVSLARLFPFVPSNV